MKKLVKLMADISDVVLNDDGDDKRPRRQLLEVESKIPDSRGLITVRIPGYYGKDKKSIPLTSLPEEWRGRIEDKTPYIGVGNFGTQYAKDLVINDFELAPSPVSEDLV
jgi:hypothetical protein